MAETNTKVSNQEQTYKRPSKGAIVGGFVAGTMIRGIVESSHQFVGQVVVDKMTKISQGLTKDEFKAVEDAIDKTIIDEGLAEKGVRKIKATPQNTKEINKVVANEIDNHFLFKKLPEMFKGLIKNDMESNLNKGTNAFYAIKSKAILMPEKGLNLAIFHEIGHAANRNLSQIGKALQKTRAMTFLVMPISLIALCKGKKAPNEKPKSNTDKATTFIKENAGKLTFATFLPMLIEEGMASAKGNNFAKKLLKPELAQKVVKTNVLGFTSYAAIAILSSFGLYIGTKVRDSIAKPVLVENKTK